MRLLTGADVINFYETRYDLLVLGADGEFAHLDRSDVDSDTTAYGFTTTSDGSEVQVLLERSTIDDGEWFADALDDDGDLTPDTAGEMADIINSDAGLRTTAAVREISDLTAAWEKASTEADRLAAQRARRIADFADTCGSQSAAARLLGLDQSTVNKLVKKAKATNPDSVAAQIIARAREAWSNSPEVNGGSDAFDFHIATVGVQAFGELYNEAYVLANEGHEVVVGGSNAQLEERKERAARLFQQVLPELESYAADCRAAQYTGWSRESGGQIRRVR